MSAIFYSIGFVILFLLELCLTKQLPNRIKKCQPDDSECMIKSAKDFIINYKNGNKEIGLPGIEPFTIDSLVINEGSKGAAFSLTLLLLQTNVIGLSNIQFNKIIGFSKDPFTSKYELYGMIPKLSIKGKYKCNGKIFVLPIEGYGDMSITIDNLLIAVKLKPNVITLSNGEQQLQIDKLRIKLEPSKVQINLSNLFNGDKTLGDNMNKFLNENWKDIWNEMSPAVHITVQEIIKNVIQIIFNNYSYSDILELR